MNYRKKIDVNIVNIPKPFIEGSRGGKCGQCCSNQKVIASLDSNDPHKNDVTGVYMKKGTTSDVVTFKLEDCKGVELPNYGVEGLFPNDDLAVGFIYDWKEILQNHGKGTYTIRVDFTIAGLSGGYELRKMDLRNYSFDNVKNSVRIYSEFNSYFEPDDIDFTGSNFKDTVRFNGFFGNREPETEVSNLIGKNREVEKVIRENLNKHTLRTDLIEIGMSNQLIDFHLLSQDVTKISDYNRFNHDYNILDKSVVLIDTPKVEYKEMDRRMLLTATFGDKKMQDRSFYR